MIGSRIYSRRNSTNPVPWASESASICCNNTHRRRLENLSTVLGCKSPSRVIIVCLAGALQPHHFLPPSWLGAPPSGKVSLMYCFELIITQYVFQKYRMQLCFKVKS